MAYNKVNLYKKYLIIVGIVKRHYIEGVTTYKGIWRQYVYPTYPISYTKFIEIINTPHLEAKLRDEKEKVALRRSKSSEQSKYTHPDVLPTQLDLFEKYKVDDKSRES